MEKALPNVDSISNIHLWSKPRSQKEKRNKDDILLEISKKTGLVLDLRIMNTSDLEELLKALSSDKKCKLNNLKLKADYVSALNSLCKAPTASRLSLPTIKQLVGVFSE